MPGTLCLVIHVIAQLPDINVVQQHVFFAHMHEQSKIEKANYHHANSDN